MASGMSILAPAGDRYRAIYDVASAALTGGLGKLSSDHFPAREVVTRSNTGRPRSACTAYTIAPSVRIAYSIEDECQRDSRLRVYKEPYGANCCARYPLPEGVGDY